MPTAMRMRLLFVLLVLCLCTSYAAFAQMETATLSGVIQDPNGRVVPDVEVTATRIETGVVVTTKTNGAGIYYFTGLMPGRYHLMVRKPGFKEVAIKEFQLYVQDKLEQNFALEIGSVSETVTVTAGTPLINTESATVSTVIDSQFVQNIPLNGRSFQSLIALTPGVVLTSPTFGNEGQFSVNGQRANSNYFNVDGVSANIGVPYGSNIGQTLAGSLPGLTPAGGTNSLVPVDALQEFRIETSSYAAEFGRSPGGQVSIVTRSGSNQFHGTLFEYLRNDVLDANDWFNNATINPGTGKTTPRGEERQNDFGGVVGGPIVKDRTFFFGSYEGLRLRQPFTQQIFVPSLRLRSIAAAGWQPILNAFPLPEGPETSVSCNPSTDPSCPPSGQKPTGAAPFTSSRSNPSTVDSGGIRIDHKIRNRLSLFGRYSYSRANSGEINVIQFTHTESNIQTVTVGSNLQILPNVNNELRFNYSRNHAQVSDSLSTFGGGTPFDVSTLFPSFATPSTGVIGEEILLFSPAFELFTFQVGKGSDVVQRQVNLVDNLSFAKGAHALKFGIDYRHLTPTWTFRPYDQVPIALGQSDITGGTATILDIETNVPVKPRFQNLSLYAQDTWKISRRVNLTYGLRWELNPVPSEASGREPLNVIGLNNPATAQLAPQNSAPYETTYNNFAPRIGLAYQLSQKATHETVLRGGFGVFYDLGNDQVAEGYRSLPFTQFYRVFGVPIPVPPNIAQPRPITLTPPLDQIRAIDPNLKLPYTLQWNFALQQALGASQALTLSYVGSAGHRLLRRDNLVNPNPNFVEVLALRNAAESDYNSMQVQFNRHLSRGLQALASYTYSHSIDDASDGANPINAFASFMNPRLDRGASDFDVRHTFSGAFTYDIPSLREKGPLKTILGSWSIDSILVARSGLPVDLVGASSPFVSTVTTRPDVVPGKPLYISNALAPGGKQFNPAAFLPTPTDANGNPLRQGTLGRNVLRGFGAWQADFGVHRQFNISERVNLQFRSEIFNIFNHPNFGTINPRVTSTSFGLATSMLNTAGEATQVGSGAFSPLYSFGGPRSVQFSLRLAF
ncbi:MAG TPA: TonB-dependent receptor [Candidatus Acidoferrum sp.]|nr:TonB-dependent receptor [Candidatus Acidoferrum sp.]